MIILEKFARNKPSIAILNGQEVPMNAAAYISAHSYQLLPKHQYFAVYNDQHVPRTMDDITYEKNGSEHLIQNLATIQRYSQTGLIDLYLQQYDITRYQIVQQIGISSSTLANANKPQASIDMLSLRVITAIAQTIGIDAGSVVNEIIALHQHLQQSIVDTFFFIIHWQQFFAQYIKYHQELTFSEKDLLISQLEREIRNLARRCDDGEFVTYQLPKEAANDGQSHQFKFQVFWGIQKTEEPDLQKYVIYREES